MIILILGFRVLGLRVYDLGALEIFLNEEILDFLWQNSIRKERESHRKLL